MLASTIAQREGLDPAIIIDIIYDGALLHPTEPIYCVLKDEAVLIVEHR